MQEKKKTVWGELKRVEGEIMKKTGRPKSAGKWTRIHFRIPEEIYNLLQQRAAENNRSTTGELITILEKNLK